MKDKWLLDDAENKQPNIFVAENKLKKDLTRHHYY
jgi:hypothetical protein